jgi:amino acid adenylation domain-containing protein
LGYGRPNFGAPPPVLELPTDKPRPLVQSYHGGEIGIELGKETVEALRTLSRNEGMTLFMVLLATFEVLLWRRSGQEEIVVGSPVAGRTRSELEGLIGFFVNTLALRVRVEGNLTFRDLLGRVKEAALGAYAHQEVPFEKVVEELATERDLSRTPVFQVMMMLQNLPRAELDLPGLKLGVVGSDNASVKFDLSLILVEGEQGIGGWLRYDVNLFERATIERMIRHWELLLTRAVTTPEKRLSELSLLPETEQRQVLYEWNNTQRDYPSQCLHEVFEQQVQSTPHATAVVFADQELTYAELNARANQLAHYLQSLGVRPEVLVAISMERSIEMIVAILGVLKAGGAYVPLDPTYPMQRLSFMLEDTSAPVLLTQEHLSDGLPAHWGQTICLDSEWSAISQESTANPESTAGPDNLAYVIYTSGSTGTPKGVLIQHFSIANLARAQADAFHLSAHERVLQFASFSFDASVSELFKTLCTGGTLCLAPIHSLLPGIELLNLLEGQQITAVTLPPSALKALPAGALPRLQRLIVAGEACRGEEFERWDGEHRRIFNAYGPTEATVCASVYEYQGGEERPPIGRPISNTQLYVLDEQMQAVPIGATGQLYVGGVGVARGYWKRPELTAERFIPDPYAGKAGARMYRTGDLGRWLASGQLEYVGREDEQVKVRGHRIEPGEIEAVLREHADIRDAVVTMKEDAAGEKRLIAYVVAPGEEINVSEVRRYLGQRLPGYMTPAAIVKIAELPLTENGKVDRRALPEPDSTRPELAEEYLAPRTELEQMLTNMWKGVVRIDKIGVHDNFFDVGGDSIKGAVIINKLQEELSEFVHVVALFDAPTVAQLAAYLTEHFPEDVRRFCGDEGPGALASTDASSVLGHEQISARAVEEVRQLIVPLKPREQGHRNGQSKNRSAIFVLSPPRSGSTLLRVMLGGHPALFAPPELELLSFNTLDERRAALSGRYSFWLEGTLRALMQAKGCTAEQAKALMSEYEEQQLSTREFYRLLQEWLPDKRLVDKTPSYALDEQVLESAEINFENALYIHLVRHPQAMIRSFVEARLEQVFFRYPHTLESRALAEALWVISHENIGRFLATIPAKRQHVVKFEELVESPARSISQICDFLGIAPVSAMLEPYKERSQRMTDGIHPLSKMLGDVKFHEHQGIEREVADRWKQNGQASLTALTWRLATSLGYHRERPAQSSPPVGAKGLPAHFVAIQPRGTQTPLFCVHPASGHVYGYTALARSLGPDQPLYGIQSPSLFEPREPFTTVKEMAAYYVESLVAFQPQGPYILAGHSSGGQVAFEMAQTLVRQDRKVLLLALFDTEAVASGQRKAVAEYQDDAMLLAGMLRYALPLSVEHLQRLKSEERLLYIFDLAKQHQLIPPDFQLAQARHFLQTLRANVEASASYVPEKYTGAITLFRASERDVSEVPQGETLGWESVAKDGVEVHMAPGNHVTMIAQPNVQTLADLLSTCLQRAADR